MPVQRQILCVGADGCVRPHGNAPLLWMMDAGQMSNSLCRGGLPRPPAITTCLSCFQLARVVGASRSCRSRWYTLVPLLSVATLSSPGPRAQHPTSHRVGRLVTDDLAFDGNKFFVGADRGVPARVGVSVIVACGQAWKPAPTGLGSKSGMPVQRQILCVGADRCVRPRHVTITVSRRIFLFVRRTNVSFVLGLKYI